MGYAVSGFFANGGTKAYIASTNKDSGAKASEKKMNLKAASNSDLIKVVARSAGKWGDDVKIKVSNSQGGKEYVDIEVSLAYDANNSKIERFVGIHQDDVLGLSSSLVEFNKTTGTIPAGQTLKTDETGNSIEFNLEGGADQEDSGKTIGDILEELKGIDDISLIVMPEKKWGDDNADIQQAITHAQFMKDRMVLVQMKDDVTDWKNTGLPTTQYASAYYPMATATVKNGAGENVEAKIAVTGHLAGVIARTDATKGAWTAAAGTHADVKGITALNKDTSQVRQEAINTNNVNALRYINGAPTVWGARTRDKGGIYEYQPVTRTAFLIADSLRTALHKVVFAKNTEVLWKNLKASVTGFMTTLYAQGAFQGNSASQAFEVACGLNESMSQTEIDQGLLRVTVRFRPAKPAEFIEVSVEQLFEDSL
jgi:hypothetical protein